MSTESDKRIVENEKTFRAIFFLCLYFFMPEIMQNILLLFLNVFSQEISLEVFALLLNVCNFSSLLILSAVLFSKELKSDFINGNILITIRYGVIVLPLLMIFSSLLGSGITGFLTETSAGQSQSSLASFFSSSRSVSMILVVIIIPFVEEMVYRFIIFSYLNRISTILGYLVSSLIFGFMHISLNAASLVLIIPYFLMGISLSYVYAKTDNIYVPVVGHILYNFIAVLFL